MKTVMTLIGLVVLVLRGFEAAIAISGWFRKIIGDATSRPPRVSIKPRPPWPALDDSDR